MNTQNPAVIEHVLAKTKYIAVVGHSPKPQRPSYQVSSYMRQQGYTVYPVHPAASEIDGHRCYARLADVPDPIDMVNVFRRSEFLPGILDELLTLDTLSEVKCLWTQLGIYDAVVAQKAMDHGWQVVMDACLKIEFQKIQRR
ncbi:CoA-binding protein [Leptolyngbya cf. ectocarpi LEGE 11479]|uniref:CoA-binding protein n=1 Tax=Leptolyngbya cf. ectocarpi LEGE 11479 TaxID=1828722 RepID=A0A928ZZC8_LEPEC|nr:CoA-binding protein [Leptolyngbya ectocarpi]MBE9070292.1 CoA-binding protein [Leptolyngbya cf. ectocarpi LEGE 11479]